MPIALEVSVVHGVEAGEGREQADVGLGDRVAHQVAPTGEALRQPVESVEQVPVRTLVGDLGAGEAAPVDAVVDIAEHELGDLVDLVAVGRRIEVGGALAMQGLPLGREVERHLGEVVGDDLAGRDVDQRRHRDPLVVPGVAGEERLLQAFDSEHRITSAGVEVERPAPFVVGGSGDAHRHDRFEAE